jgi:hypothetical protein
MLSGKITLCQQRKILKWQTESSRSLDTGMWCCNQTNVRKCSISYLERSANRGAHVNVTPLTRLGTRTKDVCIEYETNGSLWWQDNREVSWVQNQVSVLQLVGDKQTDVTSKNLLVLSKSTRLKLWSRLTSKAWIQCTCLSLEVHILAMQSFASAVKLQLQWISR